MTTPDDVTVFRAPSGRRVLALVGMAVLAVLTLRVVLWYGWLATIGAVLVALIIGQLWWAVLRPRLTADLDGVEVLSGARPERIAWTDIQRTEVSEKGTLIVVSGGREVVSRFPFGSRRKNPSQPETEADRAAV